ncbi:MAG: hypothetical protein JO047_05420 [Alphaproteobacteria bacterium]|nr:hypothetical protein [Alphaproteobacteria bacterium]
MSFTPTVIGAGCLAALVGAGAAAAQQQQQHPPYLPTRDVAVTYEMDHQGAGPAKQARVSFSASSGRLRLDLPSQKRFFIFDQAAKTTTVVMVREHIYLQMPLQPEMAGGFVLNADMKYARGNPETIAGQHCTDWQVETDAATGTVCVTDDGVLLLSRGQEKQGSGSGGLQAVEVSYDPQPATLFIPPAEFRKVDISEVAGTPAR